MNPATPTQGKAVAVRVGVYNKGNAAAGAFKVQWFAGENYPTPACEWTVESLVAKGGTLTCNYAGYPSWYAKLTTKVVVDSGAAVAESDEANNIFKREDQRRQALRNRQEAFSAPVRPQTDRNSVLTLHRTRRSDAIGVCSNQGRSAGSKVYA